ncbi:MAG: DinB family protein [Acidobacteriota bacterium]|nr:DinB family protein [Acidobacteriota bacterium]
MNRCVSKVLIIASLFVTSLPITSLSAASLFIIISAVAVRAQQPAATAQQPAAATPPMRAAAAGAPSYRADFLKEMDNLEKKLVSLAEAMPADKFTWRPMDGVRSVSEVYTHLAGSNFNFTQFLGITPPAGAGRGMEKMTDKAQVVEMLKQSLAHVRQAATNTPDADWDKTVTYSGRNIVVREAFFRLALGMREHLGQSVAYARVNRIVPPWTAEREAQQSSPAKPKSSAP